MKEVKEELFDQDNENDHVSVIYFHGIGNQRRFQETGRLIDSLETYCFTTKSENDDPTDQSTIHKLEVSGIRSERSNDSSSDEDVSFVEVQPKNQSGLNARGKTFRFYEVYWAPLAAKEVPPREVVSWLFNSGWQTVKAWFTSRWRGRPSIRRMTLHELRQDSLVDGIDNDESRLLAEAYSDFSTFEARNTYPKGKFKYFLKFMLESGYLKNSESLIKSAKKWKWRYRRVEFWNCLYLITFFLFIILLVAAILWSAILLIDPLGNSIIKYVERTCGFIKLSEDLRIYNWINTVIIGMGVILCLYIQSFLRKYVGDVQFWGTYEETNTKYQIRKQILRQGVSALKHALKDSNCNRIVIIAHSLGSSIAFNSLLEITKELAIKDSAENIDMSSSSLSKFDQFITLGCPIDKIKYFFGCQMGKYSRVDKLQDDIRGTIADPPFSINHEQKIRWINYHDVGDIISGSIESVLNFSHLEAEVDNIRVACSTGFPNPGSCHTEYFSYRRIVQDMYSIIFDGRYSSRIKQIEKIPKLDYTEKASNYAKTDFRLFLLLPWVLFSMIIVDSIKIELVTKQAIRLFIGYSFVGILLWLLVRYITGRLQGHRDPLMVKR